MLIAATIVVAILAEPVPETWLIMGAVLATGALGLFDDASKVAHERSLGLSPKSKTYRSIPYCKCFCLAAVNWLGVPPTRLKFRLYTFDLGIFTTTLPFEVPAGGDFSIPWLYLIFADILLAGMSNATNLTDGLDGLLSGTFMSGHCGNGCYCFRAGLFDSAIVAAAFAGCCIGFCGTTRIPQISLWVIQGPLPWHCAWLFGDRFKNRSTLHYHRRSFVVETLSVMIQVFYFKRTRKRLFLMAPLHHHFEKKGWSEVKVVIRFWIISAALAAVGFCLYFAQSLMG